MKSVKQQYIDLKEGKMSQFNFLRNLRMTLPQYITNITSFNDAVKILKNKGILTEDLIKGGKADKKNPDSFNSTELAKGIKVEMEHTDDPKKAKEIAMDHLVEDPAYYSKLSQIEGDYIEKNKSKESKSKKRTDLPMEVGKKCVVDKANQMKTPKGVTKDKASANKAKKETIKPAKKVQTLTHNAKKAKGIKSVEKPIGKEKKIKLKEGFGNKEPKPIRDKTVNKIHKDVNRYRDKYGRDYIKDLPDYITSSPEEMDKRVLGNKPKKENLGDDLYKDPVSGKNYVQTNGTLRDEEKREIKRLLPDVEFEIDDSDDQVTKTVIYSSKPRKMIQHALSQATGQLNNQKIDNRDLGSSFNKFKSSLEEMIDEILKEQKKR